MATKVRLGLFSILYLPFAAVEILAIINTSTSGELNLAGWVSGILGIIVCFPWLFLGIWVTEQLGVYSDDYFREITILSVVINLVIFMFIDGMRYRRKHKVYQAK